MKIGDEVYVHGYVDEIRNDTIIIRNDGGYFGTVESEISERTSITCPDCIYGESFGNLIYCVRNGSYWNGRNGFCSKAQKKED